MSGKYEVTQLDSLSTTFTDADCVLVHCQRNFPARISEINDTKKKDKKSVSRSLSLRILPVKKRFSVNDLKENTSPPPTNPTTPREDSIRFL